MAKPVNRGVTVVPLAIAAEPEKARRHSETKAASVASAGSAPSVAGSEPASGRGTPRLTSITSSSSRGLRHQEPPPSDLGRQAADIIHRTDTAGGRVENIDYGEPVFGKRPRKQGPLPLRVRFREYFCGSDAFFTLFGWRFLRRSLIGIWRALLSYTALAVLFVALMEALSADKRTEVEDALRGFTLLFEFTRVFLVFTLTAVVGTMYTRWWDQRKLLASLLGRTQDTTIMVATYIQGEDTAGLKCDMVRYLNLACVLMLIQARGKHGQEVLFSLEELAFMDMITGEEQSILRTYQGVTPLHSVACMWFLQLWTEAVREGLVPEMFVTSVHQVVQENVIAMRSAGGDVFMHQNTPPPIGYFRVLYMLLNVSLLISPFGVYASLMGHKLAGSHMWMVVPIIFVITFFLLSFINMCYEMFDPFQDAEGSHFPLKYYLEQTMRATFALLEMPREGRLRYYSTMGRVGTPSEEGSASISGTSNGCRLEDDKFEETPQQAFLRETSSESAATAEGRGSGSPLPASGAGRVCRTVANPSGQTRATRYERTPRHRNTVAVLSTDADRFGEPIVQRRNRASEHARAREAGIFEAEQLLHSRIQRRRTHSLSLLPVAFTEDDAEIRALRDIQEGRRLLGSLHRTREASTNWSTRPPAAVCPT